MLGSIDPTSGSFVPLTFCPGYLRGLAFAGDYAVVGLSRPRHDKTFGGLALDQELVRRGADARVEIWEGQRNADLFEEAFGCK